MRNAIRTALQSSADAHDDTASHNDLAATKFFADEQGDNGTEEAPLDCSALSDQMLPRTYYFVNCDTLNNQR